MEHFSNNFTCKISALTENVTAGLSPTPWPTRCSKKFKQHYISKYSVVAELFDYYLLQFALNIRLTLF